MPLSATRYGKTLIIGWSKPTTPCSKFFADATTPPSAKITSRLKSAKPMSAAKLAAKPKEKTKPKRGAPQTPIARCTAQTAALTRDFNPYICRQCAEPGNMFLHHLPLKIVRGERARGADREAKRDLSPGRDRGSQKHAIQAPCEIVSRIGRAQAVRAGVPGLGSRVFHRDRDSVLLASNHRCRHILRDKLRRIGWRGRGAEAPALIRGKRIAAGVLNAA